MVSRFPISVYPSRAVSLLILLIAALTWFTGCAHAPTRSADPLSVLDERVPELLETHRSAGAGIALIRDGEVVGTRYYGEQAPGVPVTAETVFNTASVAKTVTAETLLALAAKGLIDPDEPIHPYVDHPGLGSDPRFRRLTPRLLMSHRSGLLNWSHEYEDGKLAFVHDPGATFSYSGAGVRLAARYAEAKLGRDFEDLAFEHVLTPLGIEREEMSLGRLRPWLEGRLAEPMDETGAYRPRAELAPRLHYPFADGGDHPWSAADDLLTTVDAYAELLTALPESAWLPERWRAARSEVLTSIDGDRVWNCEPTDEVECPVAYGHGFGWMVYEWDDHTLLKHGGGDAGESALAHYSPDTGDGAVIFVNGGNGIHVVVEVVRLLGAEPELAAYYRQLLDRLYS